MTFVGRDAERQVLGQVLAAARSGRAGVVQIVGEPGIGKTRLLGQLHELAGRAGFAVLSSRGTEFDRDVPYGVLTELVDDLVRGTTAMTAADRAALTAVLRRPSWRTARSSGTAGIAWCVSRWNSLRATAGW